MIKITTSVYKYIVERVYKKAKLAHSICLRIIFVFLIVYIVS